MSRNEVVTCDALEAERTPLRLVGVRDFGARGDGLSDDREAIQRALNFGAAQVLVPAGTYRLGGTLRLPSGSWLKAHPQAHFVLADEAGISSEVFLLANADPVNGNENIRVEGGIWDGNNRRNPRGKDVPGAYTGVSVNFVRVDGLEFCGARMWNAESYFIRGAWLSRFRFADLEFWTSHPRPNQDGVHIAGNSRNGSICRLRGVGPHATQDDLVALVADDALERAQNLGLVNGPISDVLVQDLEAEDCHSFVRLASVFHAIENVEVERVRGGCEACAVNMDALRYCAVPLFVDGDGQFPGGAGFCRRIRIRDLEVHRTRARIDNPLLLLETRMTDFRIENFRRNVSLDAAPHIPSLRVHHTGRGRLRLFGAEKGAVMASAIAYGKANVQDLPQSHNPEHLSALEALLDMENPLIFSGSSFTSLEVELHEEPANAAA